MRLGKYLAISGVASRRAAEGMIAAGRVRVAGAVVTDPARDVGPADEVAVDGHPVGVLPERLVYAVHKPAGVVSTARDPQGRTTVVDLVPADVRLYPVGRLDIDTTGLILLTNDGDVAHRLTHPRFEVPKTYRAVVSHPPVRDATVVKLASGVRLDDGMTAPAQIRRLSVDTIELTIHEGRKRQVKRMCDAVGHPVRRLQRVAFGPLALGGLAPGAHRRLGEAEVQALLAASYGHQGPTDPGPDI